MPATWTDTAGREWRFQLTVPIATHIRDLVGIDLCQLVCTPELINHLAADPCLLVDVISISLTDDILAREMDAASFAAALLDPDVLKSAAMALLWNVCDIVPGGHARILRTLLEKEMNHGR